MTQVEQQVLPTIVGEIEFHKGNAMSTQEVVQHESDLVAQISQKPSNDMTKGSENMLPTIGETRIHESITKNSEEEIVVVEHQSDHVMQTLPKPSNDMIEDIRNMPLRDDDVEGSEKKDKTNEELQDALTTKKAQEEVEKGTSNTNKVQTIQGTEQGSEGSEKSKGTYFFNVIIVGYGPV